MVDRPDSLEVARGIVKRARKAALSSGILWIPHENEELLRGFVQEVHRWSMKINLVGRAKISDNIFLLILDSLILLDCVADKGKESGSGCRELEACFKLDGHKQVRIADIGSGSGFPGVVWKLAEPRFHVTLFERRRLSAHFLLRTVSLLSLEEIEVVDEDAGAFIRRKRQEIKPASRDEHELMYDCMLAKAAGGLKDMLPLAAEMLKREGVFISLKGAGWRKELGEAEEQGMKLERVADAPLGRGQILLFRKI